MKRYFKYYRLGWLISLIVFNIIAFITQWQMPENSQFDGYFWIGYIFITLAFLGQLGCSYYFFREDNKEKIFLNIPIISISYSALIVALIAGVLCMFIPSFPYWIGVIICLVVLAFYAIAIIKTKATSDIVEEIDAKIKTQTLFIKSLTTDVDSLLLYAKSDEAKEIVKKVYEAVRYSDPMSNEYLLELEQQISESFQKLSIAVKADDIENIKFISDELMILIQKRNHKCKMLK